MVQATLMRAWEHRSKVEDGTNLVAWLFTILRNTHFNQRKRLRLNQRKRLRLNQRKRLRLNQRKRLRREVEDADGVRCRPTP